MFKISLIIYLALFNSYYSDAFVSVPFHNAMQQYLNEIYKFKTNVYGVSSTGASATFITGTSNQFGFSNTFNEHGKIFFEFE